MKVLENAVESFDADGYKQLCEFIKSKPSKRKRKDLLLLELVRTKEVENNSVISDILELDAKSNAYHALRKRLLKLVMHFVHFQKVEADHSVYGEIEHLISFGEFWSERGDDEKSLKFLQRASVMAEENQFYCLQEKVQTQLLSSGTLSQKDIERLAESYSENQSKKEQKDRTNLALTYLVTQVLDAKKQNRSLPYQLMVDHTLRKFNLDNSAIQNPKILLEIISVIKNTLSSKKDYFEFEKYLEAINTEYFSFINFSQNDHYYYLQILYITAHTYYKNRKFERGLDYSRKLGRALYKYEDNNFKKYFGQYELLNAGLLFYSGKIKEARSSLINLNENQYASLNPKEQNHTLLNLAYYTYSEGDFAKAQFYVNELKHTDNWYEKRIGEEWALKKGLIEAVIHVDSGDEDKALEKINNVVQNHHKLLSQQKFARIGSFLKITRQLIVNPDLVLNPDFEQLIEDKLLANNNEEEDLQSLSYYAWLKSKKMKIPFYKALLQIATRNQFSFV